MKIDISALTPAFPEFRVAVLVADGLVLPLDRPPALAAIVAEREQAVRARWAGVELGQIPGIAVWRAAYKGFGIKKTSYRCSVERLVKNVLAERPLPAINGFVDTYNAVSASHVFPIGADDIDRLEGDLYFRYSRPDDSFVDMASEAAEPGEASEGGEASAAGGLHEDPPKPGEVVYADASKVLCRRWNWRQDARSLVGPETRRAVLTVQANGVGALEDAVADVAHLIERFCGARTAITIADRREPIRALAMPA